MGNVVSVVAGSTSTIDTGANTGFTGVTLGALTVGGGATLNINGLAGKLISVPTTTLAASGGTFTFNTAADLSVGQITDSGTIATINKSGAGHLVLDNTNTTTSANSFVSGTSINVQAGTLNVVGFATGSNPLGLASVTMSGGNVVLDTKQAALTFDNTFNVTATGTIQANVDSLITTLGSATRGISVGNGAVLTFDTIRGTGDNSGVAGNAATGSAGAILSVAGAITGQGGITEQSTSFGFSQSLGLLSLANTGNTYSGPTTVTSGTIQLAANGTGPLNSAVAIASGATFDVNGKTATIGSLAGAGTGALNVNSGVLTIGNDGTTQSSGAIISGVAR